MIFIPGTVASFIRYSHPGNMSPVLYSAGCMYYSQLKSVLYICISEDLFDSQGHRNQRIQVRVPSPE